MFLLKCLIDLEVGLNGLKPGVGCWGLFVYFFWAFDAQVDSVLDQYGSVT